MKKVLLVAVMLFASLFTYCYGQDVKVNINNQDFSTNKDCEFTINGICSSEDIGGVDVEFESNVVGNEVVRQVVFTNYNSYTVTTLCVIEYRHYNSRYQEHETLEKTFNIVLTENGSKKIAYDGYNGSVKGMIVRKLKD